MLFLLLLWLVILLALLKEEDRVVQILTKNVEQPSR